MKILTRPTSMPRQKASEQRPPEPTFKPAGLNIKRTSHQQRTVAGTPSQKSPSTEKRRIVLRTVAKPLTDSAGHTNAQIAARSPAPITTPRTPQTASDGLGAQPVSEHSGHLQALREQLSQLGAKIDALTDLVRRMNADAAISRKAAAPETLPTDPERGLDAKEAAALLGIGRATFYEMLKRDDFVSPIKVGKRSVRYSRADLLAWRQKQTAT